MMIEYSKVRTTFGRPLADRQAIQFMIADSAMELHACRLMVYSAPGAMIAAKMCGTFRT